MISYRISVFGECGRIAALLAVCACSSSGSGAANGGTAGAGQAGSAGSQAGSAGSSAGGSGAGASGAGGAGTAGTAGSAGSEMTEEAACRAAIEAQCEARMRCASFFDIAHCATVEEFCPEYYFSAGSTRSLAAVSACLDTLRNESCTELNVGIVPACLTPGTVADGAPCRYHSQCASAYCDALSGGCGKCVHGPGANEACASGNCAPGFHCDQGSVCLPDPTAPPAAEGQPCQITGTPFVGCQGTLACGPTATSSTPECYAPPSGENTPCPGGACAPPFNCDVTIPAMPVCSAVKCGSSPGCDASSTCFYDYLAGTAMCVPYVQLGQPCNNGSEPCSPGLFCGGSATCITALHRGDPCQPNDCPTNLTCTGGVCSLPQTQSCP